VAAKDQPTLFDDYQTTALGSVVLSEGLKQRRLPVVAPRGQLLKWIGNKQRFAADIVSCFPSSFRTYFEPFLGSGAVLATLAPAKAIASDSFAPIVEIWQALKSQPDTLVRWYRERYRLSKCGNRVQQYEKIKASYNRNPNGADLIFLCRSCYGGVVRFRQADGYMSTPCGVHEPISPEKFAERVAEWHRRVAGTDFNRAEFEETMSQVGRGDLVYCDPPYACSQSILYGAQSFSLERLFQVIEVCVGRGAYVALSIDGTKKSGEVVCQLPIPSGLFKRQILLNCGRSMLKRFQMKQQTLEGEVVADRLLLTY
jgi:DNA adenine methylase